MWSKLGIPGMWACRGVGRVMTRVICRNKRTGRGITVWVAYTEAGARVGGEFKSRQQAIRQLEVVSAAYNVNV